MPRLRPSARLDTLIWTVMRDRGYPASDRNASIEAFSVYHAHSLEGYRRTQDLRADSATTEELREAMIRSRALFQDLTGLREGQVQPARGRVPEIYGRGAVNDRIVAANSSRIAENTDRTADTPR
jgi:hypothetical protein